MKNSKLYRAIENKKNVYTLEDIKKLMDVFL